MQVKVRRSGSSSSISTTISACSNTSGKEKEDTREILTDIFGSKSSGLGSERRSSSICVENLEVEEEEGEESSSKRIPSPQVVSPLLSPDSCLEEESLLEEPNLCIECATRAAVGGEGKLEDESLEGAESNLDGITPDDITPTKESSGAESEDGNVENESVEVSSTLRVSSDKLESLLGSLEQDKHYPSLSSSPQTSSPNFPKPLRLSGRVSIASSSPSRQADRSPSRLRKTSSLKSGVGRKQAPGRSVR